MLENIVIAKSEDIERSRAIVTELESADITPKQRLELQAELERLAGPIRRTIIQEVLNDLNGLGPLLRGTLLGERTEAYTIQTDNKAKIERYGWEIAVINGQKMMFDPARKGEPKYEAIPKMAVEKSRVVYMVETNRAAVARIAELLQEFLDKLKGELRNAAIDTIIEAKRSTEVEIAKVDRKIMERETFNESQMLDADYIPRPPRFKASPDDALYRRFDALKAGSPA